MTNNDAPDAPDSSGTETPSCGAVLTWLLTLAVCTLVGVLMLVAGALQGTGFDDIPVSSSGLWQARLWVLGGCALASVPWLWLAAYRRSATALVPVMLVLAVGITVALRLPLSGAATVF